MSFYSHGTLDFELEDNILIIKGRGPWNLESLMDAGKAALEFHKILNGKKWAVLAIIHGQPIHTPDAALLLVEAVIRDKKNGRVASALILDKSDSPELGRHHITNIYRDAGENFEFFSDIEVAKNWLKKQLEKS